MKARALVPALALAAALLAPPVTEAGSRHRSGGGHRPTAHGYYGHRSSHGSYGYGYRTPRPYRYNAVPYGYYDDSYYGYGYGYGGAAYGYGYGYYPPPPPRYCPPRPRIHFWFGF